MGTRLLTLLSILVGAALFLASVLFAGTALRFWRVDLTADNLYTLSDGTRNILGSIDEPLTVRLFYSKEIAADIGLDGYGRRVRELLEEFENAADGKLVLQVIEPEPYSAEEELATSMGIRGQMVNAAGDLFFFGLAATNSVDDLETIPSLNPSQEGFLEYELAKLCSKLSSPDKPKVAVLSTLPLQGGAGANPFGPPQPGWRIVEVLRETFEVEFIGPELTAPLDTETDVLLLVHPKELTPATRFAIDQYALGGGKVCALVDPHSYAEPPPPGQQQMAPPPNPVSELPDLLSAWGLQLTAGQVVGDLAMAQDIPYQNQLWPFPLFLEVNGLSNEGVFNGDDVVTADMRLVTFLTPGELSPVEEATTTFTPLIQTTPGGRSIATSQVLQASARGGLPAVAPLILDDFALYAQGTVTFTGVPADGATLTLNDGLRAPMTFEFRAEGEAAEGNEKIDLAGVDGPEGVANALQMAVLIQQVTATDTSGIAMQSAARGATVELTSLNPGPAGDVDMRRTGKLAAELDGMQIRGEPRVIAARVQGPIQTAFPAGAPEDWEGLQDVLTSSTGDFNAIVVADADFLHEQFWTSQVNQGGFLMQRRNDNPTVLINALENLTGSNDLLSLRSRGIARRPFERKEDLRRQAQERFQAKKDELDKQEQKLQGEIAQLVSGGQETTIITQQQAEELADKQQELVETRKELGRVKGDLNRDIESLGTRIKLLNILATPSVVALAGLLIGLFSLTRRKSK
jgi:gliding motility-associatede transport system auxiliary component